MYIAIATPKDKKEFSQLWQKCFNCDEEFFELFYNKCYPHSRTYFVIEDSRIVSCASILKSKFISDTPSNGGYLYGVCTHEEYRGRGFAKAVIEFAMEESLKWGLDYIVTRPATKDLFQFYRNIGFNQTLYRRKITLPLPSSTEKIQVKELKYNTILPIRKYFLQKNYFAWNPQYYDYLLGYLKNSNGIALEFHNNRYLIGHPDFEDKNCFNILELGHPRTSNLRFPTLYYAENIIKELYPDVSKITMYIPPMVHYNDIEDGETEEFVVIKSDSITFNDESFFNFTAE